ncbi:P-loop containing nucleoside triphosphate hydrolase protein [Pholiota conissans]|uniref:P-loop containing nucleoside triphosphate hydrolase protein n=1 Tax=Pholiota conissans TaxID=109636 RepID=A0A9P6D2E1_9AGAR|nr:P-loop containing nucleoside triphosphate hydrolase protein [Pholiota conissans]
MGLPQLPALPAPSSWFPGHMMRFTRQLPALLKRTNVVLEIRDARLPLTSINRTLEGALRKWRLERGWDPNNPGRRFFAVEACEHIVVLNKRDIVPEWGLEPFQKAMEKKFPHQRLHFASCQRQKDIRNLSDMLVKIAKDFPHAMELNVLVLGMPNVGKSTLLNALRNMGIKGRTPKAFQTSANPGMTQALSTRLKLSLDPLVYAYDSPGIMLPFLGRGEEGAERGVKLALIAGIKEGLYDMRALAGYLLYRLNILNPNAPAYLPLLPPGSSPTNDLEEFLSLLAQRMAMIKRGGVMDLTRATVYFVRWWRGEVGTMETDQSLPTADTQAWGFDFQWTMSPEDRVRAEQDYGLVVQEKMERCIEDYVMMSEREEVEEGNVSETQIKKKAVKEEKERRKARYLSKR